jgi:hypothetical protein
MVVRRLKGSTDSSHYLERDYVLVWKLRDGISQLSSFLAVFLLVGLVELITEIEDLAIGLGLSLIATDDADDLLCQFGSIGPWSLSKQRRRRNNQNPQDQQPVHKFPRDPRALRIAARPGFSQSLDG